MIFRTRPALALVIWLVAADVAAQAQTFKIAQWNIASGLGRDGDRIPGGDDTILTGGTGRLECDPAKGGTNAWAVGYVQQHLIDFIKNDPSVVALVTAEAWRCATPVRVAEVLGWTPVQIQVNGLNVGYDRGGVTILARHGFVGQPQGFRIQQTDHAARQEERWVIHGVVKLDPAGSQVVDVYGTHIDSTRKNGTALRDVMAPSRSANSPHVMIGDFNTTLAVDRMQSCGSLSPGGISLFTSVQYRDTWPATNPGQPGYTSTVNRPGCGNPPGAAYKRIDLALSWGALTPRAMRLFGHTNVGGDAPSDHYGVIAEYRLGACPPCDREPPIARIVTSAPDHAIVSGPVTVPVDAIDNVGVARVDLRLDGAALTSWAAAPYSATWDTTTVGNGVHTLEAVAFDEAGNTGQHAIALDVQNTASGDFWTSIVNAPAGGATLRKTSGCGTCADAGGVSVDTIASGDGYVEFTPSRPARIVVGLGPDRSFSTETSDIRFAFHFWTTGTWDIREDGDYRTEGTHAEGDVFRIAIESGVMKYYQNGALVYTSAVTPEYPLGLDVSLLTMEAGVSHATLVSGPPDRGGGRER